MSWFDYLFDSDYKQRRDLLRQDEDFQSLRSSLSQRSNTLESRVGKLEAENAELKLMNLVLLRVLLENGLVTEVELSQLAQEIDMDTDNQAELTASILSQRKANQEPTPRPEIKINFGSARERPKSLEP